MPVVVIILDENQFTCFRITLEMRFNVSFDQVKAYNVLKFFDAHFSSS